MLQRASVGELTNSVTSKIFLRGDLLHPGLRITTQVNVWSNLVWISFFLSFNLLCIICVFSFDASADTCYSPLADIFLFLFTLAQNYLFHKCTAISVS